MCACVCIYYLCNRFFLYFLNCFPMKKILIKNQVSPTCCKLFDNDDCNICWRQNEWNSMCYSQIRVLSNWKKRTMTFMIRCLMNGLIFFVLFCLNEMKWMIFFLMINANKFAVCVYVAVNQIFDFFPIIWNHSSITYRFSGIWNTGKQNKRKEEKNRNSLFD